MTRRWWAAAAIVLISNLAALGGAAWNRRSAPEAVLELSERELALPPAAAENTALALRLRWTDPANNRMPLARQAPSSVGQAPSPADTIPWFDRAKLEELGFDCSLPLDEAHLARYRAMPPRRVFAVLEHGGEAWRIVEQAAAARGEDAGRMSRLVVVDAGLDRAALRARWADRSRAVVVPAIAVLGADRTPGGRLSLRGRIAQVFPSQLNVPRPMNGLLAPLQGRAGDAPGVRYRVRVAWGRSDPWVDQVRLQ